MYQSLYQNQKIHHPFYSKNYSEVPIIAAIKSSPLQGNSNSHEKSSIAKKEKIKPVIIPAIDASDWPDGFKGHDIRPRFFDTLSKEYCLVDSGAVVTAVAPCAGDVVRPDPLSELQTAA